MSGWTYILIGGVLLMLGSILTTHGWNKLKKAEEAFSLSVPPSIELGLYPNDQTKIQDIIIQNTGQHDLINLEITPVAYLIQIEPPKILSRNNLSQGIGVAESLKPKDKITISSGKLTFISSANQATTPNTMHALSLVIVFRREADNKRFVEIEPFLATDIENKIVLFPLYSGKRTSGSGSPYLSMNILKEIIETEKLLFKAN